MTFSREDCNTDSWLTALTGGCFHAVSPSSRPKLASCAGRVSSCLLLCLLNVSFCLLLDAMISDANQLRSFCLQQLPTVQNVSDNQAPHPTPPGVDTRGHLRDGTCCLCLCFDALATLVSATRPAVVSVLKKQNRTSCMMRTLAMPDHNLQQQAICSGH